MPSCRRKRAEIVRGFLRAASRPSRWRRPSEVSLRTVHQVALRRRRWAGARIADVLKGSPSSVSRILRRAGPQSRSALVPRRPRSATNPEPRGSPAPRHQETQKLPATRPLHRPPPQPPQSGRRLGTRPRLCGRPQLSEPRGAAPSARYSSRTPVGAWSTPDDPLQTEERHKEPIRGLRPVARTAPASSAGPLRTAAVGTGHGTGARSTAEVGGADALRREEMKPDDVRTVVHASVFSVKPKANSEVHSAGFLSLR